MEKLEWGLSAHPEDAPAYWGARAILKFGPHNPIDLLPNRQSGGGPQYKVLTQLLNEGGGLKICQARTYALLNNFIMSIRENQTFILLDTPLLRVVANTRASHGYLYMSAWLKPEALNLEGAKWSGSSPPPKAGDVVGTKVWKHPVEVLTPMNLNGHYFLVFMTGRTPEGLEQLRSWRKGTPARPNAVSAVDNFNKPSLAVGLTVGNELQ